MSITVGWNAAVGANVSREDMDAWALRSHQRAVAGIDAGSFVEEIFPLDVVDRDGTTSTFAGDENPRRDTSMEKLASLKPLHPEIEGFSITAGGRPGLRRHQRPRLPDLPGVALAVVRETGQLEVFVGFLEGWPDTPGTRPRGRGATAGLRTRRVSA
jgi:hypothetical protein